MLGVDEYQACDGCTSRINCYINDRCKRDSAKVEAPTPAADAQDSSYRAEIGVITPSEQVIEQLHSKLAMQAKLTRDAEAQRDRLAKELSTANWKHGLATHLNDGLMAELEARHELVTELKAKLAATEESLATERRELGHELATSKAAYEDLRYQMDCHLSRTKGMAEMIDAQVVSISDLTEERDTATVRADMFEMELDDFKTNVVEYARQASVTAMCEALAECKHLDMEEHEVDNLSEETVRQLYAWLEAEEFTLIADYKQKWLAHGGNQWNPVDQAMTLNYQIDFETPEQKLAAQLVEAREQISDLTHRVTVSANYCAALIAEQREAEADHQRALREYLTTRQFHQQQASMAQWTDDQIVALLASLGIDSTPSIYGFPELQVATTVPGIRQVLERAKIAPPMASYQAMVASGELKTTAGAANHPDNAGLTRGISIPAAELDVTEQEDEAWNQRAPGEIDVHGKGWPERRAVISFVHPTLGDGLFTPLFRQAMEEFKLHDDDSKSHFEYVSTGGVHVTADFSMYDESYPQVTFGTARTSDQIRIADLEQRMERAENAFLVLQGRVNTAHDRIDGLKDI